MGSQKVANRISDSIVVRCLGNTQECNLFPDVVTKDTTTITSKQFTCVENRGNACSSQVNGKNLSVVYFIYTEESGNDGNPNKLRIPSGYQWCVGAHFEFKETGRKDRRILCGFIDFESTAASDGLSAAGIQFFMIYKMGEAVDSVKQEVEACFSRECDLDTKVSDF